MEQKEIKIATLGIADEFRRMNVGDVVRFPADKYNYNSIRSTRALHLCQERMAGQRWKTRIDFVISALK